MNGAVEDDVPARLQEAICLRDPAVGLLEVLEHRREKQRVRVLVRQGDVVGAGDDVDGVGVSLARHEVDPDVLVDVGGEELLPGLRPAPDVEKPSLRVAIGRIFEHLLHDAVRNPVVHRFVGMVPARGAGRREGRPFDGADSHGA